MTLNRVEVGAMKNKGAMKNLWGEFGTTPLDTGCQDKHTVSVALNQQVAPSSIVVANLSVGTWMRKAKVMVIAIIRSDVILGMKFLYNAEVLLYYLTYHLAQESSVIMLVVEEKIQVEE